MLPFSFVDVGHYSIRGVRYHIVGSLVTCAYWHVAHACNRLTALKFKDQMLASEIHYICDALPTT